MNKLPTAHAWLEINGARLSDNISRLLALSAPQRLIAVVKANGYGHGAVGVGRLALQAGAAALAVATPAEGITLREAGIKAPIHVLGALYPGEHDTYRHYGLTAMIATPEAVASLTEVQGPLADVRPLPPLSAQLKVDTGMHRIGFSPDELPGVLRALLPLRHVHLYGLVTHFATADDGAGHPAVQAQVGAFLHAQELARMAGWQPALVHAANTAAVLQRIAVPGTNAVRIGLGMYGLCPGDGRFDVATLQQVGSFKTRVAAVKRVPADSGVSYGHTYVTDRPTTLCTLPVGYADGMPRALSNKAAVLIRGHRRPIVGRICMDQCLVDMGNDDVAVGDEVVILGEQGDEAISVVEWARMLDTIPYEVVTGFGARLPRVITHAAEKDEDWAYWGNVP